MEQNINKQKNTIAILIIIYALVGISANLAHPITPSYLKSLNMPSTMFGVVFATMSLTNFAFSPFWGVMSRYMEAKSMLLLGTVGYAIGQLMFGLNSSPWIIIMARLISGAFISAVFVASGYYVVAKSEPENKSKNITKLVTVFSVSGTVGYFIGGYMGTSSLLRPFIIQAALLVISGLLFYFLLEANEVEEHIDIQRVWSGSNPFVKTDKPISKEFRLLFLAVLLTSIASTSLTQTFAYYLVDTLQLTSFENGLTKGFVGIGALFLNFTLSMQIVKSKKTDLRMVRLFMVIAILVGGLLIVDHNPFWFAVIGVIAMSFDTMPISLLQGRNANFSTSENQGEMLGIHNSMKALGGIIGSLVAGWIYERYNLAPFVMTATLYVISMGIMFLISKGHHKEIHK